ncbi:MAG: hypothetical protein M3N30_07960 [Bacteroidota bacterium]|nr:hypothetical protein [Bacteroidota bacterium]
MSPNCRKYKTSRQQIREIEPAYLASFLDKLMPDAQFRFITFEKDDYKKANLTFLLCKLIPEKVMVSVEHASDLRPAIHQIMAMNPRVKWNSMQFSYPAANNTGGGKTAIELRFTEIAMIVNAAGTLVVVGG